MERVTTTFQLMNESTREAISAITDCVIELNPTLRSLNAKEW